MWIPLLADVSWKVWICGYMLASFSIIFFKAAVFHYATWDSLAHLEFILFHGFSSTFLSHLPHGVRSWLRGKGYPF
jgi:hypothetical protein